MYRIQDISINKYKAWRRKKATMSVPNKCPIQSNHDPVILTTEIPQWPNQIKEQTLQPAHSTLSYAQMESKRHSYTTPWGKHSEMEDELAHPI